MTVIDAGANAGLTTYQLSRLVGPTGKVYALEPDTVALGYLERNIRRHGLSNVEVCPVALSDSTGQAEFNMDGSLSAGLVDHIVYKDTGRRTRVETMALEDFCMKIGRVPDYVKMDIEGAELSVVEAALGFLGSNPISFAFESCHKSPDGSLTSHGLERLFRSIGYTAESSERFGLMFTWAMPPGFPARDVPGPGDSSKLSATRA
jgi:FkbM family methyltransferase